MLDELLDLVVALDGDGDDSAGAGGDLLDIREGLFVLEDAGGVVGVLGGDADDGERLVDEGVGAVLHLAGGVAFGVDVGDLLELERAFEGDGVVDAAAEEEEVVRSVEEAGEVLALLVEGAARGAAALGAGPDVGEGLGGRGGAGLGCAGLQHADLGLSGGAGCGGGRGYAFGHSRDVGLAEGEHGFELGGELAELGGEVEGVGGCDGSAGLGEVEREEEERCELRGEGLGGGDADLGPGVGGDGS